MTKGKSAATAANGGATSNVAGEEVKQWTIPEQYKVELSGDVVGFGDPDVAPVEFIPEHAVLTDSTIDPTKTSVLVIGRLAADCMLYMGDEDIEGTAGDLIGIWGKPGMKGLRDAAGVPVFVVLSGTKAMKESFKQDMKLYTVVATQKGGRLPIEADYRDKSKNARNFLEGSPLTHANPTPSGNGAAHDDAGF